jgi:hypothetical protein
MLSISVIIYAHLLEFTPSQAASANALLEYKGGTNCGKDKGAAEDRGFWQWGLR